MERKGGKGRERLQEVKETLLLPRKHPFASERHLPTLITSFWVPLHFPICSLFLLSLQINSLQIKYFRPLLLETVCAFILRAGSRTLST
jgi:hypothetical protein